MKKALVISGGGSKGAFAGGVAEYLIQKKQKEYDLFIGSSTGSLMISHLALGMVEELKMIYTNVRQRDIFSNNPFKIKQVNGVRVVNIHHINVLWNFLRGRKTFGESNNLRKLIKSKISREMFAKIIEEHKEVVVTLSNLTANKIEYKTAADCNYNDFCDWIWGSCNYVPFMSLLEKNCIQYADGSLGSVISIKEAVARGAKEIDAIILETEVQQINNLPAKNPFSLMLNVSDFMLEQVEKHNIILGKLLAKNNDVKLNLYYTPTILTTNSLIFNKQAMTQWWKSGYKYAQSKDNKMSEFRPEIAE